MEGETVTVSTLVALAVSLINVGLDLINKGQYATGALCVVVGFGVMVVGFTLYEKGIIGRVMKLGGKKRRRPDAD